MTLFLDHDGWEPATWDLSEGVNGARVRVEIDGTWHVPQVNGTEVVLAICGPDYDPTDDDDGPAKGTCAVITTDTLARVKVRGVIRRDEWIRLRPAPTP